MSDTKEEYKMGERKLLEINCGDDPKMSRWVVGYWMPEPNGGWFSDDRPGIESIESRSYRIVTIHDLPPRSHESATRPPSPALKVAREALEKCKSECSCGAIGCVGHDDTCPVHLKQDALALLAKEGV
jgi:hypothetical protein